MTHSISSSPCSSSLTESLSIIQQDASSPLNSTSSLASSPDLLCRYNNSNSHSSSSSSNNDDNIQDKALNYSLNQLSESYNINNGGGNNNNNINDNDQLDTSSYSDDSDPKKKTNRY